MGIFQNLHQKLNPNRYPSDYWPSVVVLMAEPMFPSCDEILSRAQKAWGNAGPAKMVGNLRDGASHVIQCGPMSFSIHSTNARYGGRGERREGILQRPWEDHKAWMSIDLPKVHNQELYQSGGLANMYKVLLVFVFLSWNNNCLGVYFPGEGVTIPNFGNLAASINWGRQSGLNLNFLN